MNKNTSIRQYIAVIILVTFLSFTRNCVKAKAIPVTGRGGK
jgi:hypothetical protein